MDRQEITNKLVGPKANDPSQFFILPEEDRTQLLKWIKENISIQGTKKIGSSSYALKHYFERSENGFYITNGVFKGAMLEAFKSDDLKIFHDEQDKEDLNWHFNTILLKE